MGIHARTRYDICHFLILNILFGCVVNVIIMCVLFPGTSETLFIILYWIYMFFYGMFHGVIYASIDAILVELVPKEIAGKGFGAKVGTCQFVKAFPPLIVGILWDYDHNWLFYVQGWDFAIVFVLACVFVFCEASGKFTLVTNRSTT